MAAASTTFLPAPADQAAILIHDDGRTENALIVAYRIDGQDMVPVTYPAATIGTRVVVATGPATLHLHGERREYSTLHQILEGLGHV